MSSNHHHGSAAAQYAHTGYGVDNLPFGSVSTNGQEPWLAIRLGDQAYPAHELGRLAKLDPAIVELLQAPNLDSLLQAAHTTWAELRAGITAFLSGDGSADALRGLGHALDDATFHLPFTVADYVDFYASEHHASNVGKIFRPDQAALLPNWHHLPVGYHGRSGTIVVSGTDIVRPKGLRPDPGSNPTFGPSQRLDIETELGFVVGGGAPQGEIPIAQAENHIFGVVVVNDWSARDIQAFEYVPLGPFLGKSFATSIGAWVVPLPALDHARVQLPQRVATPAPYLDASQTGPGGFDIRFEVEVDGEVVSRPPYAAMYYSGAQMLTHMVVNGASLRPGDFFASGTISGPERDQRGSLLELTWGGSEPLVLGDGTRMEFIQDGQNITLRATAPGAAGGSIALGEVCGRILPATPGPESSVTTT